MDLKIEIPDAPCRRCGACCRKGGPALHLEDRGLVEVGRIPLSHLFTIRQYEPAYDNVAETVTPADTDILRMKSGSADSAVCIFYDGAAKGCRIYDHRPLECRIFNCRRPESLIEGYDRDRLTREHLLSRIEGLWDLVEAHQQHCDYRQIADLAAAIRRKGACSTAVDGLLGVIRYDRCIRQGLMERSGMLIGMLDLLLGRPLAFTIGMFQLKLVHEGSQINLRPFVA